MPSSHLPRTLFRHNFTIFLVLAVLALAPAYAQSTKNSSVAVPTPETRAQRDARMEWWRASKYGMFIHWGVYAIPAQGEWYMSQAKVPVAEYAKHVAAFNPVKFNAKQWARIAQDAGMKYVVLTAKHHDGFALFDSKVTAYDIMDAAPFKRDVVRDLAEACRAVGLKFGVYYSHGQDWHHPGGGNTGQWDPAQAGDAEDYINTIAIPQVRELLQNYGPLDLFWWDSSVGLWSPNHPKRAERLYQEFQAFPKLIINNRLYDAYRSRQFNPEYWESVAPLERFIRGDYATPEGGIPGPVIDGIDWESCLTINGMWGYKPEGERIMPPVEVVHNLIDIVSKGGNLLLNVGPDSTGLIPAAHVESLRVAGEWLKNNGEAIYGAGRTPFGQELGYHSAVLAPHHGERAFVQVKEWRATTKPGKIYIHFFQWPKNGKFQLPTPNGTIKQIYLLADASRTALKFSQHRDYIAISLPISAPDPIATVFCIELDPAH